MRFTFTIAGDKIIDRRLERMEDAVADFRPAWAVLHDRFLAAETQQFSSEGEYGGQRWAPLSSKYAARKMAMVGPKPILERSGDLMRSLTSDGDPGSINVQEHQMAAFGTAIDYGAYHQRGGGHLPRRPIVAFPEEEKREWVRVLQRFLVTGRATI